MAANGSGGPAHEANYVDLESNSKEDPKLALQSEANDFMQKMGILQGTRRQTSFFDTLRADGNGSDGAASAPQMERRESLVRATRIIRVALEWRDLSYSVVVGKNKASKTILDGVSAQIPPGRLLAVMGPTGCGKTSLINALAGRLPIGGSLSGEVLVNGLPRGPSFRAISAYVMQDDVLFSNLTVRETFEFAARMRLPPTVTAETKDALVTQIITELGLIKAQGTRIGNAFVRGVSGGERKRTNIGIELLSGASILFLDEPTSGLDAFQAQNVMESLWVLAGNGRTVISTIHQPRSSICKMLDLLLLLSEGRTMYFGPAAQGTAWFGEAGFTCPEHFNPADFMLDVVSMDYRSKHAEEASRHRVQLLGDLYKNEGAAKLSGRLSIDAVNIAEIKHADEAVQFPNGPLTEFWLLLRRSWKQQSRDRVPQIITFVQTTVIGFILAALYSNMDSSATPVQDETGILFFCSIFAAFNAMFGALNTFPAERGVVNRERSSKMYHVAPYYIARFICDIPLRVSQGVLFGAIVYWIVGLNPSAAAFFIFVCLLIVEGLTAQGLGIAVSAGCKNERVSFAVAPGVTVILILFGGFYINSSTVPDWLQWVKYLSHLYWGFMGLTINNFEDRAGWKCPPPEASATCSLDGNEIIKSLGFQPDELWFAFVGLFALLIGFNLLGYILLRRSKPKYLPLADAAAVNKKHT